VKHQRACLLLNAVATVPMTVEGASLMSGAA
jgi:hypothetical protein